METARTPDYSELFFCSGEQRNGVRVGVGGGLQAIVFFFFKLEIITLYLHNIGKGIPREQRPDGLVNKRRGWSPRHGCTRRRVLETKWRRLWDCFHFALKQK